MKKKNSPFSNRVLLSDLCNRVNDEMDERARTAYLDGAAHRTFDMAESWTGVVRKQADDLASRRVLPFLRLSPTPEEFFDILTASPRAPWVGCLPDEDGFDPDDDIDPGNELVPYDAVEGLSAEELRAVLIEWHNCVAMNTYSVSTADKARQEAYYKAVLAYFDAAAACALFSSTSSP